MAKKKAAEPAAADTEAVQTKQEMAKTPEQEVYSQADVVKHANGITAYNY